jgi:hypothetical protein
VNLTPLEIRFNKTCFTLVRSALMRGRSSAMSFSSLRGLPRASGAEISRHSSTSSSRSKASLLRSSLPASIREMSRMLLMSWRRWVLLLWTERT